MIIYKITNTINNKVYIGQTIRSLNERIADYEKEARYRPNSRPISRAINKYGIENFKFDILEDNIESQIELDALEKYYIKYYNSLITQNGYNVELGGNGIGKHSPETCQKISNAQLGDKNHMYGHCGKLNTMSKPVIDLTTGIIYESANLASQELKLHFSHICACARGTRGSTGDHVFRYVDADNNIIQPEQIAHIKTKKTREKVLPEFKNFII